jgi:hypothetical protein
MISSEIESGVPPGAAVTPRDRVVLRAMRSNAAGRRPRYVGPNASDFEEGARVDGDRQLEPRAISYPMRQSTCVMETRSSPYRTRRFEMDTEPARASSKPRTRAVFRPRSLGLAPGRNSRLGPLVWSSSSARVSSRDSIDALRVSATGKARASQDRPQS